MGGPLLCFSFQLETNIASEAKSRAMLPKMKEVDILDQYKSDPLDYLAIFCP